MKSKKIKIYISDEGFGPIIRQNAIITELLKLNNNLNITVQTHNYIRDVKRIIKNINYIDRFNNIVWIKNLDGTPNVLEIEKYLEKYPNLSEEFIRIEKEEFNYDFIISDFVPEAFKVSKQNKKPAFGVAHFTWDWFFLNIINNNHTFFKYIKSYINSMDTLYVPPFTPKEILASKSKKIKEVPLIVSSDIKDIKLLNKNKFNILIMDSGGSVLHDLINSILIQLNVNAFDDFQFYISSKFGFELDHVTAIDENELFVDYIPKMDLVIGRAGFNTISECIAYRTPLLMLTEENNPEMASNINYMLKTNLCGMVSKDLLLNDFETCLKSFIDTEYKIILDNLESHDYRIDGARVIAKDILNIIT